MQCCPELTAMRKTESTLTFPLVVNSTGDEAVLKMFSPVCWFLNNFTTSLQQKTRK